MNGAERNNKYACIFTASVAINRKKCAARHGTGTEREREEKCLSKWRFMEVQHLIALH